MELLNKLKIIERKASKPHAVYRAGKANSVSYTMTIPKLFAIEAGLDELGSYVVTHLVVAHDNGMDPTPEEVIGMLDDNKAKDKTGKQRGGGSRKKQEHQQQQQAEDRKVYLIIEKFLT